MTDEQKIIKPKKSSWREVFAFIKDYFVNSDEKLIAWLYLIGIVLCVIALVALTAGLAWWSLGFWAALTAKELIPFLLSMGEFSLFISGLTAIHALKNYLTDKLSLLWRTWLTNKTLNTLFKGENNFLDLKRINPNIDNIAQRIQEDIKSLVNLTLTLGADFLKSVLSLGTFLGTLWVVGGALTFVAFGLNIVIPGFLVWLALLIAIVASLATFFIGKSLAKNRQECRQVEADLRKDIELLNQDAENIAQEHAEPYYQQSLEHRMQDISNNTNQRINIETRLVSFQQFYMQISNIVPYLISAPLYFTGMIEFTQLAQIATSFGEVSASLSWFIESFDKIAHYKTDLTRFSELQQVMRDKQLAENPKEISLTFNQEADLHIKDLNIMQPLKSTSTEQSPSTNFIMQKLNLDLKPGQHILIKGQSGLGKSTLFKAISGTWKYGSGEITIPSGKRMYFLPQKPTLPNDQLRGVLAYPEPDDTYTQDQYVAALSAVGMDAFIPRLHECCDWSKQLSGGQQQLISFARVLLKKPDWLFLDEATASLDEENEDKVYRLVKTLPSTTMVSIAHRNTVEKHHSRILYFRAKEGTVDRQISIEEQSDPTLLPTTNWGT